MTNAAVVSASPIAAPLAAHKPNPWFNVLAGVVVVAGIIYAGYHLADDLSVVRDSHIYSYVLLGIALLIALGFEFVNGFHDTANANANAMALRVRTR
jgi:PiT family inorganic phosphate transporter